MKTKVLSVDKMLGNEKKYKHAVDILKSGGLVAFPTETVYGLGALATDEQAVRKIFEAKGRPSDNPLIVHIGNPDLISLFATTISEHAERLIEAFWPGPLTVVLKKKPGIIAPSVTPGVETVGLRMPDHPVALELLKALNGPIAAPSANRSGKPSPTTAYHVADDLSGLIPLIMDGGQTGIGVESTVIDMTTTPPTILRPGGVTREMIESKIGPVTIANDNSDDQAPRAPGMKYMHYAPKAPLFVISSDIERLTEAVRTLQNEGKRVAVITPNELEVAIADWQFFVGHQLDKEAIAANLYGALRQCDLTEADTILAVETDLDGVGTAIMNRLMKAADGQRYSQ